MNSNLRLVYEFVDERLGFCESALMNWRRLPANQVNDYKMAQATFAEYKEALDKIAKGGVTNETKNQFKESAIILVTRLKETAEVQVRTISQTAHSPQMVQKILSTVKQLDKVLLAIQAL